MEDVNDTNVEDQGVTQVDELDAAAESSNDIEPDTSNESSNSALWQNKLLLEMH